MRLVFVLCCLCYASLSHAQLPTPVMQALQAEGITPDQVSVWVQRLDDGKLLFSHEAQVPRNPASVIKLLTSYAALDLLTPNFRWNTQFYTRAAIQSGKISSGLWVRGSGDPSLSDTDLYNVASEIRQKWAVQEICCQLWLDSSAYKPSAFNPAAFDGKPYRAYNAPAEAIMLNQQSLRVEFSVNSKNADSKTLSTVLFPDLPGLKKKFDIALSQDDCGEWKERLQVKRDGDTLSIKGSYAADCGDKYLDIYWQDGQDFFARGWQTAWANASGTGAHANTLKWSAGSVPNDAWLLHEHISKPLADIVRDMNKTSNNVVARALYLALARYADASQPASEALAERALRDWLQAKNWNFSELVLENGSGLSRLERINAEHLGLVLSHAFHSPVMPELLSSLPVYGLDGTLKSRKDAVLYGKAHLKTGSLEQVRAIAGYMLDKQGRRYALVWMVNGERAQRSKAAQEAMLNWLYQQ